jgi:hypothetical protein
MTTKPKARRPRPAGAQDAERRAERAEKLLAEVQPLHGGHPHARQLDGLLLEYLRLLNAGRR